MNPKAQNFTSGRAPILAFGILVFSLENLFSQYNEITSKSKLPFHNPLVMNYYNVLAYFSLDYENFPFTKFSWYIIFHINSHLLYLSNTHKLHCYCVTVDRMPYHAFNF